MTLSWLFSDEVPLPQGYSFVVLHHASGELGAARLTEAASLLGKKTAKEAAEKLGRYELDEEAARKLGLAGAETGENGEVPALSPERWAALPEAETLRALRARLGDGTELAGLLLNKSQRESFLRFLARNQGSADEELTAEKAVSLARHFFFQESLMVVIRRPSTREANA